MYFAPPPNGSAPGPAANGKLYLLSSGDRGIEETALIMRALIRQAVIYPVVKQVAVTAVANCRPTDQMCYVASVYEFTKKNFLYIPDCHNVEEITAPWIHAQRIIDTGSTAGDCDDFTVFQCALLRSIGTKTRLAVIATPKNRGNFDHVRAEAFVLGRWFPLETTSPKMKFGEKLPSLREEFYEV